VTDPVRDYLLAVFRCQAVRCGCCVAEMARLESEGFRLVDGDPYCGITDFRTGEVLASCGADRDEYEARTAELAARQPLFHGDHLLAGTDAEQEWFRGPDIPPGMSESFASSLRELVEAHEAEVAAWLGADVPDCPCDRRCTEIAREQGYPVIS
jgi:hypothetical protein